MTLPSSSLTDLDLKRRDLLSAIEAAQGVISPEQEEELRVLDEQILGKCDTSGWVIRRLETEADMFTERAHALAARARARTAMAQRLRERLAGYMQSQGIPSLRGEDFSFSLGHTDVVELTAPVEGLAPDYIRRRVTVEADKDAIKQALKSGTDIPGTRLTQRYYITIR